MPGLTAPSPTCGVGPGAAPAVGARTIPFSQAADGAAPRAPYAVSSALSSPTIAFSEAFASPNSIAVLSRKNSGFWMPA